MAGIALPIMGYEIALSTGKSNWNMQPNTGIGLLLITAGLLCLGELIAKAFDK